MPATYRQGSPVCCNPNISRLAILLSIVFFVGASLALLLQKPACPVYECTNFQGGCLALGKIPAIIKENGSLSAFCGTVRKSPCLNDEVEYFFENPPPTRCSLASTDPQNPPFPCPDPPPGSEPFSVSVYLISPETGPICFISRLSKFELGEVPIRKTCNYYPNCLGKSTTLN